jgi:hypothetical protein
MSPYLEENMTKYLIFTLQVRAESQIKAGRLKSFSIPIWHVAKFGCILLCMIFVITNYITKLGWKKSMFKGNVPWSSPKTKRTPNCLELTPHEHSSQHGTPINFGFSQNKWQFEESMPILTHSFNSEVFPRMKFLLFQAQVNSGGGFATSIGRQLLRFDLDIKPVIHNRPASYWNFYNRLNNHCVLSFQQSRNVLGW